MLLPPSFYLRTDVVQIARELLGKHLFTHIDGAITSGIICETEAYAGISDRASHAYHNKRTPRTEIMYRQGGTAYVYLCYGMHSLFNVVTNQKDIPHAVLIRGILPDEGKEIMLQRAGKSSLTPDFGTGPGKVSKILGIHYSHTGLDLTVKCNNPPCIWIEDRGYRIRPDQILTGTRIGIDYAGKDALLPYRFQLVSW